MQPVVALVGVLVDQLPYDALLIAVGGRLVMPFEHVTAFDDEHADESAAPAPGSQPMRRRLCATRRWWARDWCVAGNGARLACERLIDREGRQRSLSLGASSVMSRASPANVRSRSRPSTAAMPPPQMTTPEAVHGPERIQCGKPRTEQGAIF